MTAETEYDPPGGRRRYSPWDHPYGGEKGRPSPPYPRDTAKERRRLLRSPRLDPLQVHLTPDDQLWTLHPEDVYGTPEYNEANLGPAGGFDVFLPRSRPRG